MKEAFGTVVFVTGVLSLLFVIFSVLTGETGTGNYGTFKRCVEVGVEVSKCNEIAGFEKEK